jgi:hypothetical protein
MTSTDRNYLMPAQEKLEWVTPKISLMGAGDTDEKQESPNETEIGYGTAVGPS